jgi:hypothetical protein
MHAMVELTAVHVATLRYMLSGPKGRRVQRVLTSTLDALNAISYKDITGRKLTDDTRVDGTSPACRPWHCRPPDGAEDLSELCGVRRQTLNNLLRGFGTTEQMPPAH